MHLLSLVFSERLSGGISSYAEVLDHLTFGTKQCGDEGFILWGVCCCHCPFLNSFLNFYIP